MIKEIFGKKIGMTQIFNADGDLVGVTLLEVEPVCVLEKIEYASKKVVKIGVTKLEGRKINKLKKPVLGYFNKLGFGAYRFIKEVIADPTALSKEVEDKGSEEKTTEEKITEDQQSAPVEKKATQREKKEIGLEIFSEGDIVHVRAKTKGKGFAGGMKKYGWAGQPRSHGSTSHRRIGSVGSSAYPSRIIKGLHMPGHMGNVYRIIKNLKVVKVDTDKNLLIVKGGIPGRRGSIVKITRKSP
ncbi:MAG: 50S ribosomal protein L3 [Candidatus Omnitrophica bacterium]|nr:50S ribosomal protein L3 [Candidatus Omnitrophota bacterium]